MEEGGEYIAIELPQVLKIAEQMDKELRGKRIEHALLT